MVLSEDLQKKIGVVLDRDILPIEHGNVASFGEFTEADVAEFRRLEKVGGVLTVSYIRFRLKTDVDLDTVVAFYASVIQQGVSVQEWLSMSGRQA
jgi:hypothetical protein